MSTFQFFTLLSLAYIVLGLFNLIRVVRSWRALWDDELTPADIRLATSAAFYLLVPPTVALHELGHAALIWAQGLEVTDWFFLGYIGAVAHPSAGPLGDFAIALAGNVVTFVIGVAALAFALRRPGHPVRNILLVEIARQSLFLVLVFYPALCLGFNGDWRKIYNFEATPFASGAVGLAHAGVLALGYGIGWRRHWRSRAALLCSPIARSLIELERRVGLDDADSAAHKQLGLILLAARDFAGASGHLEKVVTASGRDARLEVALGMALRRSGDARRAIPHLEAALDRVFLPEERLALEIDLTAALIEAGRGREALGRAEAMRQAHPDHDEVIILWVRAMKAERRGEEARAELDRLFEASPLERRQRLRKIYDAVR